jgi:hypothetical protein
MNYCYSLSIGHSYTIDSTGDRIARASTAWINFTNYVKDKRGNNYSYRKDAEDELLEWNACLELCKTALLFKTQADKTFFLLRFS